MRDLRSPLLSEPVRSIMSEGPVTGAPDMPVISAARLLLEQRIGALPIRDGEHIVGIFTVADALDALLAMVAGLGAGAALGSPDPSRETRTRDSSGE